MRPYYTGDGTVSKYVTAIVIRVSGDDQAFAMPIQMADSMVPALGNGKVVLSKKNAPYGGVQCEIVIFCTVFS